MAENICLSGGAAGADYAWALAARSNFHRAIHWSFAGHKTADTQDVHVLPVDLLEQADQHLLVANKGMKRRYPTSSEHTNNLLRRNYYQIAYADAVYAVSRLVTDSSELKIDGGTAWAAMLYVNRCRKENIIPNLYLFDMTTENWFKWIGYWNILHDLPSPSGVYAGVGSRNITDAGLSAIVNAYKYQTSKDAS
jgi:hypothetical protein